MDRSVLGSKLRFGGLGFLFLYMKSFSWYVVLLRVDIFDGIWYLFFLKLFIFDFVLKRSWVGKYIIFFVCKDGVRKMFGMFIYK